MNTEKNTKSAQNPPLRFGRIFIGILIFAALSLLIYIAAIFSPSFADFFNRYPAAFVRAVLAYINFIVPFSLAELMLILLIPAFVLIAALACRKFCDSWQSVLIFGGRLLAIASLLFSLFVFTLGTGYRGTLLEDKLGLSDTQIDAVSLKKTAELLIGEVNLAAEQVSFTEDGFSDMPYTYQEMNKKLMAAYGKICDEYAFIPRLYSRVKPVLLSELMSYTHITGVYTYFTGEANINVAFPDFTVPYTAAHELAHQRGIAREDEANFIAFLVCTSSDDPYIRYSGYINLLEYVLDAYYKADKSENHADYKALYASLEVSVRLEQRAYYDFFQKYRDNVVADVSGAVNNSYLQSQGTAGTVSYGLVAELAVKYFSENFD